MEQRAVEEIVVRRTLGTHLSMQQEVPLHRVGRESIRPY